MLKSHEIKNYIVNNLADLAREIYFKNQLNVSYQTQIGFESEWFDDSKKTYKVFYFLEIRNHMYLVTKLENGKEIKHIRLHMDKYEKMISNAVQSYCA